MGKRISIDPGVFQKLRKLQKAEKTECLLALCDLSDAFGRPHEHSGLGIRKLGSGLFECRGNASLRFIFQNRPEDLYISFLGNHDEIKSLLKTGKYPR